MAQAADYGDAHLRHWEDAELLFNDDRWANADQLYGFSAECGLKALMRALGGMPVDATGKPTSTKHLKHIREFWPVFSTFAHGPLGARYVPLLPNGTPFDDWSVDDRYADRCHFQKAGVEPHRTAARDVHHMVQFAKQDGVL